MFKHYWFFLLFAVINPRANANPIPAPAFTRAQEQMVIHLMRQMIQTINSLSDELKNTFNALPIIVEHDATRSSIARFDNGNIFINGSTEYGYSLPSEYKALLEKGVPLNDILKILAIRFLPTVAHETRHAINEKHIGCYLYVEEDEIMGRVTQMAAYFELKARYPEAFLYETELGTEIAMYEAAWQRGPWQLIPRDECARSKWPSALFASEMVPFYESLSENRASLREWIHSCQGMSVSRCNAKLNKLSYGRFENKKELQESLKETEAVVNCYNRPEMAAKAKTFYEAEIQQAFNLWCEHYPAKCR